MPSLGDLITKSNFSTSYQKYSETFAGTDRGYYVMAESWGMYCLVHSKFLDDWHGTCYIDRWNGSGWSNVHSKYIQDTSSNDSVAVKINADSLSISGKSNYSKNTAGVPNLWRIRFDRDGSWGGSVTTDFYIGSVGTASSDLYNNKLKGHKIYSNGTIGKSQCGLWTYGNGWAGNDQDVLNYFASNKGTKAYAAYDRYFVGALRSDWS